MRSIRRRERGFTVICLLIGLAIMGVLSTTYMGASTPGGKPWHVQQQDRARSAVTAINTRTAMTEYIMRTEGRRLPIQQQRAFMGELSQKMGQGGRFYVNDRDEVQITTAITTKPFREGFAQPRLR